MLKGIDVSTWQGQIDWEKAKKEIDFAIIRIGFGTGTRDNTAKRNIEELNRLGIPYGVYYFSYAYTEEMARKEAKNTIAYLKEFGADLSYPVYFDWEGDSRDYAKKQGVAVSNELLRKMTVAFCEEIKAAGYYPGIYTNPSYIKNYYGTEIFKTYDLWLAHWATKPGYDANVWQYSDSGTVSGINGRVDMNYCYADYPTIIKGAQEPKEETPKAEGIVAGIELPEHYDTAKAGNYKVNTPDGLFFRTGPSTDHTAMELFTQGTMVRCLGHYTGDWLRVETFDNRVGFCHRDFLDKVE